MFNSELRIRISKDPQKCAEYGSELITRIHIRIRSLDFKENCHQKDKNIDAGRPVFDGSFKMFQVLLKIHRKVFFSFRDKNTGSGPVLTNLPRLYLNYFSSDPQHRFNCTKEFD